MNPKLFNLESLLEDKYRKEWDSVNVYAKHIGVNKDSKVWKDCYCIFQIDRMSKKIIRQEHVLA